MDIEKRQININQEIVNAKILEAVKAGRGNLAVEINDAWEDLIGYFAEENEDDHE